MERIPDTWGCAYIPSALMFSWSFLGTRLFRAHYCIFVRYAMWCLHFSGKIQSETPWYRYTNMVCECQRLGFEYLRWLWPTKGVLSPSSSHSGVVVYSQKLQSSSISHPLHKPSLRLLRPNTSGESSWGCPATQPAIMECRLCCRHWAWQHCVSTSPSLATGWRFCMRWSGPRRTVSTATEKHPLCKAKTSPWEKQATAFGASFTWVCYFPFVWGAALSHRCP